MYSQSVFMGDCRLAAGLLADVPTRRKWIVISPKSRGTHATAQRTTLVMSWIVLLARDVTYTSCACATMLVSVCLWRKCIGALYLILVSNSDPTLPRIAGDVLLAGAVLLAGGSSRAMLASARLSCFSRISILCKFVAVKFPSSSTF